MNLPDARRTLAEMRAAHTPQPRNVDVAFQARTETVDATEKILADVLVSLIEMDPLVRRPTGPAIVTHPNGKSSWTCGIGDIDFWRAAGHAVLDPRDPPFTLPVRARQTFGDVA